MTDTTIHPTVEVPFALVGVPPGFALQLQGLVAAAVAPLLAEIADLRAEIAALKATTAPPAEIAAGEDLPTQHITSPPNTAISEDIIQLRADMEEYNDLRASEIGQDRRRIAALEAPVEAGERALSHLDHLAREMKKSRIRQLSFTNAARLLGISRPRIHQLRPSIEQDKRFSIVTDPHHKQRLIIRVR